VSAEEAILGDDELVRAALAGKTQAFEALVERHFGAVYAIAYARVASRETAEDLAQEVFLRVYLHLGDLRKPSRFPIWVSQIARNLAADWGRRGQRASRLIPMLPLDQEIADAPDTGELGPRKRMENEERDRAVQNAVLKLPPGQREVVLLRFAEDLSINEIAQRLRLHPSTVRFRIRKALSGLKTSLESILRESAPAMRPPKTATRRALAIIAAAGTLPVAAKSALAATAGGALVPSASIADTGFTAMSWLSRIGASIPGIVSAGGKMMVTKIAFVTAIIGVAILTAGFYYSSHQGNAEHGESVSQVADGTSQRPGSAVGMQSAGRGSSSAVPQESPDLSSPEATVTSFTRAAATGNAELARACFSQQGWDYDDIWEVLTASPSSPVYPMRQLLEAVDENQPATIISQESTGNALEVAWRVTFKEPFTIQEKGSQQTFQRGDTFVLDGSLVREGDDWLFYGL
jgi:RNA polymerase sigma-70 factor (ECF subfamily)